MRDCAINIVLGMRDAIEFESEVISPNRGRWEIPFLANSVPVPDVERLPSGEGYLSPVKGDPLSNGVLGFRGCGDCYGEEGDRG
jgi:hypothetical protein